MGKMVKLDLSARISLKCAMPILFLLVLYFAWRFLLLQFMNPISLFIYAEEELYRGWIGKEILDGLKMPFFNYRADDYSGGSFLIGSVSSLFFKLGGLNAFALKMIPIVLFAGALAAWYQWLSKYQSRQTAFLLGLVFIFSPLLFTRFTLTTLGDHPETIFFTSVTVLLFFNMLSAAPKKQFVFAALLGILAGLGLWMAYIYGITIIAILIYWALKDRHFFLRPTFWATIFFFLIGFLPWIFENILSGFQGLTLQGAPLQDYFHWKFFIKRILDPRASSLYRLFAVHSLPNPALEFSPVIATHFYRFMFLMPGLFLLWVYRKNLREKFKNLLHRQSPVSFSLIYLTVFLLVTQATEFLEVRYFIPAQPFIYFLAVYSVEKIIPKFSSPIIQKCARAAYFSALIFMSLALHISVMAKENQGAMRLITPYNLHWFLLAPACQTPDRCLETYKNFKNKNRLSAEELVYFQSGVAQKLLEEIPFHSPSAELAALKARSPEELHRFFDYYFGYEIIARNDYDLKKSIELLKTYQKETPLNYTFSLFGFFRVPLPRPEGEFPRETIREALPDFPDLLIPVYWQKRGFQWAEQAFSQNPDYSALMDNAKTMVRKFSPSEAQFFSQGIGIFAFTDWQLKPYRHHPFWDTDLKSSGPLSVWVLEGAGIGLASHYDIFKLFFEKIFLAKFSEEQKTALRRGISAQAKITKVFFPSTMV